MPEFALALTLFVLSHLVPSLPGARARIIAMIGRKAYLIGYATLSVVLLAWVLLAAVSAPVSVLWMPAGWQAWITLVVSPIALFLIIAGLISPNPLSLSARRNRLGEAGAVVTITRHPVFWGFALWSASHIPPNGDLRSLLLFGSLTILAVSGFWLSDKRARRALEGQWQALARTTSIIPFLAVILGRTRLRWDSWLTLALLLAIALTSWLVLGGHAALFSADPISATRY